jgi:hypothetical protein
MAPTTFRRISISFSGRTRILTDDSSATVVTKSRRNSLLTRQLCRRRRSTICELAKSAASGNSVAAYHDGCRMSDVGCQPQRFLATGRSRGAER